jgi:hypothetical protein
MGVSLMAKHQKETLNFSGSGYYGALSSEDGLGGFNYLDYCEYVNESYWTNVQTEWCDNGYTNVTAASKGASGCCYIYEDGLMESAKLSESFSLTSAEVASAWDTNAVWDVKSYTYSNGSLSLKASDSITISQTASKLNFAKIGGKGDFKNIAAVFWELSSEGSAGNTCSYGGTTYGVQMTVDALKVKWNGKIPSGSNSHHVVLGAGMHNGHHVAPHLAAHVAHTTAHTDAGINHNNSTHHNDSGYHTQLLSLGHDHGLTTQFHLATVDHIM